MQNNKTNNQKEKESKKVYVLQHAHEDNGFDAEYLVFTTLRDAERKADILIENYCKNYTEEEKDEVDAWRTWDYTNGINDEWFVRIDEALLIDAKIPTIDEVIQWIGCHGELYSDFKSKFKYGFDINTGKEVNVPTNVTEIIDWISDHETAYKDFCTYFGYKEEK